MGIVDAIWQEIERPSDAPPGPLHRAYERAVEGIGHLCLGAAVAWLLWPVGGWPDALIRLAAVAVYWGLKEAGDLHRGGTLRDGIEDAGLFGVGLFYAGQPWAGALAILIGAYLMWRGAIR